jgi:hypothetical protein
MSQGLPLIVLEVFLGFGVPLVWAIRELIELRRYRDADAQARAQKQTPEQTPEQTQDAIDRGAGD